MTESNKKQLKEKEVEAKQKLNEVGDWISGFYQERISGLENEIETLKANSQKDCELIYELRKELEKLKQDVQDKELLIALMQTKLQQFSESEVAELLRQNKELSLELQKCISEKEAIIPDIQKELYENKAGYDQTEEDYDEKKLKLEELHKKTDAEATKSTELEKKVKEKERIITGLQEKLEKSLSEDLVLRSQMIELKKELEKTRKKKCFMVMGCFSIAVVTGVVVGVRRELQHLFLPHMFYMVLDHSWYE